MSNIKRIGNILIKDKYVYKEEKELGYLYNYLNTREFKNYLPLIDRCNDTNKYEFINNINESNNQKGEDIAYIVSNLHKKTSYNKEVNIDNYDSIYDNLSGYINYLNEYYSKLLNNIELIEYPSPSNLLFLNNYSKLKQLLEFLNKEVDNWYNLVKDKKNARVVLNHGNLSIDHLIINDSKYLISWNNYTFDSPVIDIVNFYHNEWMRIDFKNILNIYLNNFKLSDEELKLLLINICIPDKVNITNIEIDNCKIFRNLFDYIYKCEELVRPYYSK